MASDFKLFKKKDDKKITDRIFLFPIRASLQLLSRIRPQELILCSRFPQKKKKCFAVTSYSKGEGKSTVSANLAISFSKMEKEFSLSTATFAVLMFTTFLSLTIKRDLPM